MGVSTGSVSNVIAALPKCLQELRDLSVILRKINASPSEALKGVELQNKLDSLGVKRSRLSTLIEVLEKQSKEAGYPAAQMIRALLTLHKLEKQSGRSYVSALNEFEDKTKKIQELNEKIQALQREVETVDEKRKQALKKASVTDKEIDHLESIEYGLSKYDVDLDDAESLQRYLEAVKEMKGNPNQFLELSKKHSSLQEALTHIQKEIQHENLSLLSLKNEKKAFETKITQRRNDLIGLEKEKADIVQSIENLKKEEYEIRRKIDERRTELADVLKVSNNSEEIARAIRANELRLTQLQALNLKTEQDKSVKVAALRNIESQLSQSNQKKENLEREITERLKIKDFITELQHGIEQSQQEKSNLDKEIAKRQEEIALAETLKNFYVNASDYDFNRFCGWVELLKYIRNHASQTPAIVKMQIEQDVREQALQVFKGFWVSKSEFNTLEIEKNKVVKENDDLKLEVQNLKNSVEKRDEELTTLKNENKFLEAVRLTVEGGQTTLTGLRDWLIQQYSEEIENRVYQKLETMATLGLKGLDFLYKKIIRQDNA